jgi:four helix bundle protein
MATERLPQMAMPTERPYNTGRVILPAKLPMLPARAVTAAAFGTMVRCSLVCPPVPSPLTRTRLATTFTAHVARGLPPKVALCSFGILKLRSIRVLESQSIRVSEKKGYKKLKVWEKAHKLSIEVYKYSEKFPREELYGITSQLRRAAFSVPINIVEGHASNSRKEFLSFLNIANRSLVETEYLLEICEELHFLSKSDYERLEELRGEIAVMLNAFTKSLRNKL